MCPSMSMRSHFIWGMTARTVRWLLQGAGDGRGRVSCGVGGILGRYRLTQSDACFKLGRDSVLLARFLHPCAPGGRCVTWAVGWAPPASAVPAGGGPGPGGVELDPVAAGLARNLSDNGLEGQVLTGDLRDRTLLKGDRFQLVIANPPYFRAGSGKSGGQARWTTLPGGRPVPGGRAFWPRQGGVSLTGSTAPERLAELFAALRGAIWNPSGFSCCLWASSPPYAVLVEAVKEAGPAWSFYRSTIRQSLHTEEDAAMAGTLYLVATPHWQLGDLSPGGGDPGAGGFHHRRGHAVTAKLLNHLGLKKPMVSYYRHNTGTRGEELIARLLGGEAAPWSPMPVPPAISDPGEELVARCAAQEIPWFPSPAPVPLSTRWRCPVCPRDGLPLRAFWP